MLRLSILIALALTSAGCSKPAPPPPMEPTVPEAVALPVAAAVHEMDPDRHVVPAKPAAGALGGKPFAPDRVVLEGKVLTFRQGGDFFADQQVALHFADYNPREAVKLVVKPSQKGDEGKIPTLFVSRHKGEEPPDVESVNDGYALTLELGSRVEGKTPGRIFLSLPGAERSFLAGTFTASYERELNDPPEADDRPFIAGRILHGGKAGQTLQFRYAGLPLAGGEPIAGGVSGKLGEDQFPAIRATSDAPRVAGLRPGKSGVEYDCAHLPPGRYFFVARIDDGPPGWKLVDVAADSGIDAPLTVPAGPGGQLEVTVPAKAIGQVQAIPAGLKIDDPSGLFVTAVSGALGAFGNVADGKASFQNLAPGKYDVFLHSGPAVYRAEVAVEAGKTAKVDLK